MADYKTIETAAKANENFNDLLIFDGKDTVSMLDRFGLLLNKGSPKIGKAETLSMLVNVPGAGRPLDLSRSLDGKLHYTKRQITVEFSCFRPTSQMDALKKELESMLHGQWTWFRFKNSTQFWRGLLKAEVKLQEYKSIVTISGTCNPYSYNLTAWLGNDWVWDTFNFEEDTIYTARTEVKRL